MVIKWVYVNNNKQKRTWMNEIFTKKVNITGNYIASFVFRDEEEMNTWLNTEFPKLKKEHGELSYHTSDLDGLKVGDGCLVVGDGDEEYTIEGLVKYSEYSYGFVLDSGWVEPVSKCYAVELESGQEQEVHVDEFSYHEVLDRTHVIISQFEEFVMEHPAINKHEELQEKAENIHNLLGALYQEIGKYGS